jgi:hypothetical protein
VSGETIDPKTQAIAAQKAINERRAIREGLSSVAAILALGAGLIPPPSRGTVTPAPEGKVTPEDFRQLDLATQKRLRRREKQLRRISKTGASS